jgi:hypothetical protein
VLVRLCLVLVLASIVGAPVQAKLDDPPRAQVVEWRPDLDRLLDPNAEPESLRSAFPIDVLGVLWTGSAPRLELRYELNSGSWSDWHDVDTGDGLPARTGESASALVSIDRAKVIQIRRTRGEALVALASLRVVGIDAAPHPPAVDGLHASQLRPPSPVPLRTPAPLQPATRTPTTPSSQPPAPRIISRAEWGADSQYLTWTPSRVPVRKFAIHHTATSDGGASPATSIRAIYYYHAVTLGWGDIGYNYLIDRAGNVYEGRAGGPNAVGAHVEVANEGVDGIALLGTFHEVRPSDSMTAALVSLLSWRSSAQRVDPQGTGPLAGKSLPNIFAHRDVMSTDCPGDAAFALLPSIRLQVAAALAPRPTPASVRLVGARVNPTTVGVGGEVQVEMTIVNAGSEVLASQGPDPGTTYAESESYRTLGQPELFGRLRVGVDLDGTGDPDHRFRWGLGGDLIPGATRTVVGTIKFDRPGTHSLAVGVVQEGVAWVLDGAARTTVVVHPPAAASYRAGSAPATQLHFPLVMLRHRGWTTGLHLTNTTDRPGLGSLTVLDAGGRALSRTPLLLAPRGSARKVVDFGDVATVSVASAVVASDVPLAGVAFHEQAGGDWMAVEPVVLGSARLTIPLAARHHNGLNSGVQVQNLGGLPTTIAITYLDGVGASWTETARVPPMGFATFYAPGHPSLPDGFVGSAVVESDDGQPIAAQINLTTADGAAMAYVGDDGASPEAAVPLLFRNRNGWRSGLQIQNAAGNAAHVVVRYAPSDRLGGPWEREVDIAGALAGTFYLPADRQLPDDLVVSADVRSVAGQPLSLLANSVNDPLHVGTAVGGLASAGPSVTVPLMANGVEGRRTGVQVQNLGIQTAAVTVSVYDDRGARVTQIVDEIPPRSAGTFYAPALPGFPAGSIGSMVVAGRPDLRLAAVVNDVR